MTRSGLGSPLGPLLVVLLTNFANREKHYMVYPICRERQGMARRVAFC